MSRVLIVGGYGVVGGWVARHLRAAGHGGLELILAGRKPELGATLARKLDAELALFDTARAASSLAEIGAVDLVISAVQDPDDDLLRAALQSGAAHIGVVRKTDNVGPTAIAAALLAQRPALIMGHWQAGAATFAAIAAARAFAEIDAIAIAALFDYADPTGPMTVEDSGAFFTKALLRREGAWARVDPGENRITIERDGAPAFQAQPMGVLDVAGLTAVTGARNVRFDIGTGTSIGTAAGGPASHEIYVRVCGRDADGRAGEARVAISDPEGQAHLTALGVLIGAERVLGLDGALPPSAGLQFPERAIDADLALDRLRSFGVRIDTTLQPAT